MPWVYAFRLLRVSLSCQISTPHEIHAAFVQLRETQDLSRQNNDAAICMTAAVLEGLIHLQTRKADSITEVQRAIAAARAQQLNVSTKNLPQLHALVHLLDLACSLEPYNPHAAKTKLQSMHYFFDSTLTGASWREDGSCSLPLNRQHDAALVKEAQGIFTPCPDGSQGLCLSWVGRPDLYMLGYAFSAAAAFCKNSSDGHRSEGFLREALKMTHGQPVYITH